MAMNVNLSELTSIICLTRFYVSDCLINNAIDLGYVGLNDKHAWIYTEV